VLDADGRRVTSIPLPGMGAPKIDSATLAKKLRAAEGAPATESVRTALEGSPGCMAKVRRDVAAMEGVMSAELKDGMLRIKARARSLDPATLVKVAHGHIVDLTFQDPVPVSFESKDEGLSAGKAARGVARVAGTWYTVQDRRLEVYVTRLLLDPGALTRAGGGHVPDVEARHFELPGIPKSGAGCRVALAPLWAPGVLTIFADVFNERQIVVARRGEVSWDDVTAAFEAAGCKPKPRGTSGDK